MICVNVLGDIIKDIQTFAFARDAEIVSVNVIKRGWETRLVEAVVDKITKGKSCFCCIISQ